MASVGVAGISHQQAPAILREQVHLSPEEAASLSRELAVEGREAIALATCNRTEVYITAPQPGEAMEAARAALNRLSIRPCLSRSVYVHVDQDAARHLFRVAAGLESMVLGDVHVHAQVRQAHRDARACGATGAILDRLFEAASGASKRVRARTNVSAGATTIAGAAIAVASRLANPLSRCRVLVVGAGAVATEAALSVSSRGCRQIAIANRSPESAVGLAARVEGQAVRLDDLDEELARADVIFSATASPSFVLDVRHADNCLRNGRPMLVFDLALPRDVHPAFRDLPGSRVLDLDDLALVLRTTEAQRRADLSSADAIVCEQAERWEQWRRARSAVPAIAALREDAEHARRLVLGRHAADLARLAPHQQRLVETITTQLVAKVLHAPTVELRRHALRSAR